MTGAQLWLPASVSGADYPNLPAGYTMPSGAVDEFTNASLNEGNWSKVGTVSQQNASTYSPAGVTAPGVGPASSPYIGEQIFPTGYGGGNSPGTIYTDVTAQNWTRIYMALWVQVSSNFWGHSTDTNKVLIANIHSNPCYVLSASGAGAGTLAWQLRLQNLGVGASAVNLDGNLGQDATVYRSSWHRVEVENIANTPGVADGIARVWTTKFNSDGSIAAGPVKVIEYTNIGWSSAAQGSIWSGLLWQPIWGGSGGTVPATMYEWVDRLAYAGAA